MRFIFWTTIVLFIALGPQAGAQKNQPLSHIPTPDELARWDEIGTDFVPTDAPVGPVRNIAEFEPTEAILVRYPFGVPVTMIKEIADDCKVITLVANESQENAVRSQYEYNNVNLQNCEFIHAASDSYWSRDYGPWFIVDGNNDVGIVNFIYNRPRPNDNQVPVHVANHLGISYYNMGIEHTGGNYMCDGYGNAASTDLVWEENPSMTHEEIDDIMLEYLGIEQYHVTDDPLDDYIKHIDCWGKFLAPDKIIIGQVPQSDYRYEDFEAIAEYFATTMSPYGEPYRVYRVYTPGGYPSTPYSNCLIVNKKVLLPQSGSQWDDEAIASYEEAMPGYEIIGVPYGSWENTDALHCRTHEIADREMLYIKHYPLVGVQPVQDDYTVSMDVTSYGDHAVYPDSMYTVYRVNEGEWDTITMTLSDENTWSALLPSGGETSKMEYFVHAADESGRSEEHPYIGRHDPHKFYVGEPVGINEFMELQEVNCYPNPANENITISFTLNTSQTVGISFTDQEGKVVRQPEKRYYSKGSHNVSFAVANLTSGVYFYTLNSGSCTISGRFVLSH
jgi:agmatine/peptidylarginine deiminase